MKTILALALLVGVISLAEAGLSLQIDLISLLAEIRLGVPSNGTSQQSLNLKSLDLRPRTCRDVKSNQSRAIEILSDGLKVLCDTETDGGGWVVIQRRLSADVDFYRNWNEYKYGFGDMNGNFWFGNEKIHRLTFQHPYELRVDFTFKGSNYYAVYSHFRLSGENDNYRLEVSGYSGNAGDDLTYHNKQAFSTPDRDNDMWSAGSCADLRHGVWWYNNCNYASLNGVWGSKDYAKGLNWNTTTTLFDSATSTEMKIRPVD